MSVLDETISISRRTMTLFFLIDTSGSMEGSKIGSLNSAMENIIPVLKDISDNNADAEIKISVLEFSSGCKWMYPEPKKLDDFSWQDLDADGMTSLGEACQELNIKLSKTHGFMKSASSSYAPVIILMSDGIPTDDFETGLSHLQTNNWYKSAIKIAISVGEDADKDILAQFTGNIESVITVHNTEALEKMIRFVTVTSSRIGSKSGSVGEDSKQDQVNEMLNKEVQNTPGAEIGNETTGEYDEW